MGKSEKSFFGKVIERLRGIPDQDETSSKKALMEKIQYVAILLALILLISIFYAKNNQNRLTFNSNVKEANIGLPSVTFCLNSCASCSIQSFGVVNNYKDYNMYCAQPDILNCTFKGPEFAHSDGICFELFGEDFNIQTQQEFWMISIATKFTETYPQINFKIRSNGDESSFPLLLHSDNNLFFSKSVYQRSNGEQEMTFSPFFQSVITASDPCSNDPQSKCGSLTLAIRVASMLVPYTIEETDGGVAQRTITDSFSIFSFASMAIAIFFSIVLSRSIFNDKSGWVNHSTREAIIYHINTYPRTKKKLLQDNNNNDDNHRGQEFDE